MYLPHVTWPIVIDFKSVVIRYKDTSHAWYFVPQSHVVLLPVSGEETECLEKSISATVAQLGGIHAVFPSLSGQPQANVFPTLQGR